jgi:hypothetical protein
MEAYKREETRILQTLPSQLQHEGLLRQGSVCKVRTQDTDNFDEEVKPLASAR